jgi:hypothetical protein
MKEKIITLFKDLYWKIKINQSKEMFDMQLNIPRVKRDGSFALCALFYSLKVTIFGRRQQEVSCL